MINFTDFIKTNDLPCKSERVVVAMSGGVDSSVAAALMVKAGYDVVGVTMKLYDDKKKPSNSKTCCTGADIKDAQKVAKYLGIKHYVLDYQENFRKYVINDFIRSYKNGETPIPCIKCNQTVKFTDLIQFTKSVSSKILVTGHYVRRIKKGAEIYLNQANDNEKDELYNKAVDIIKTEGKASTSFLQRKLQIGYNRAARIMETMEKEGIVGQANHVGKREIL